MASFLTGQRWISESEPELGLGTVVLVAEGRVQLQFPTTEETRTYASDNAPLRRVRFRVGDAVKSQTGGSMVVEHVIESAGLLVYVGSDQKWPESELSDSISLQGPEARMFAGRFDAIVEFELRQRTLNLWHRSRKSPVRGFVGGRITLLPHQLYLAQEVASRHAPRVMLSDEVGLGKTIEAGLILHRLLLTGRANRILILVPESLVHQWFVEMLRRFNVWMHIFDAERCVAIEAGEPGANPFLDDQLVLTSIDFLAREPQRAAQATAAGWDLLVVDEAHHLAWSPGEPSREYQIVEALCRHSAGLLLLTATPEQLGVESHFARLRLLDPERYPDLAAFQLEAKNYRRTADVAEKLHAGTSLAEKDFNSLRRLFRAEENFEARLQAVAAGNAATRRALLDDLLDLHGPGRVLFRNTRAGMSGFPKRSVRLAPLEPGRPAAEWLDRVSAEFAADAGDLTPDPAPDLTHDPRILWLVALLQALAPQKVLLICRRLEKTEAIDAALRRHLSVKTGVFHEGLTLVQRDRQAAWFAEPEGARLLLCSEIGSEGRNFQFAHQLVLFDLPLNPELLEQRIGRLDRIGQREDITIHVPFLRNSPQEVLTRWYHEGLDTFESDLEGGNELLRNFGRAVHDLALEFPALERTAAEFELDRLVSQTVTARRALRRMLEQGRDRLLELNSFRPLPAQQIIAQIQAEDAQTDLEEYLLDVFEHFGVHAEALAPRTWHLNPQGITTDAFPALPAAGLVVTRDRQRAASREEVGFLTWDHPIVTGAVDLLLGSETGNCAFAVIPAPRERTLLLECCFVLECVAAARLHVDRFLPATPVRLVVNHALEDVTALHADPGFAGRLRKGSPHRLLDNPELARRTLPAMLQRATTLAEDTAVGLRQTAVAEMNQLLGHEVQRLQTLRQVNDHVRPEEIALARAQQAELATVLERARLRLEAVRLIWKGPTEIAAG